MNFYRFFVANWQILLFAILLTLFSGFGQTFLLSLYIPSFIETLKISHTYYSTIYSSATLLSGISIIFAGKQIDKLPLKTFTFATIIGITTANIVAGFSFNPISLFIAIYLLRFFGQGMLSHTAMTAMGRFFNKARGKALSVAYLGFPIAEGLFPIIFVFLIAAVGWRYSFFISAISILIILLPITHVLLKKFSKKKVVEDFIEEKEPQEIQSKTSNNKAILWSTKKLLTDKRIYILAPTTFIVGFLLTALFFFQTFVAEYKGWSIEWMAVNITAYAISSFSFSILAGPLTDRFTAKRLYPIILLPMVAGLLMLTFINAPIGATLFWSFVGISAGLNPTISNAIYAEEYGTQSLGTVRSLFTFVMVGSTAAGPIVYSLLLDKGLTFTQIHYLAILIICANILTLLLLRKKKVSIN